MSLIKQTYLIAAPPEEVWRALTDPSVIRQWTGAPAQYRLEAGAPYSLWGGEIIGEIIQVMPGERLVKTWKPENWERQDSVVTIALAPIGEGTRVELIHENVEEADADGTDEGWNIYYLGAIKRLLERPKSKRRVPAKKKATAKRGATRKATAKSKKKAKKSKSP